MHRTEISVPITVYLPRRDLASKYNTVHVIFTKQSRSYPFKATYKTSAPSILEPKSLPETVVLV